MERNFFTGQSINSKLKKQKGVLAIAILFALALTYGVLLTRPFEYQASVQLLITQTQSDDQDLLSTLRATEQVGQGLVDVINTSTFFEKVIGSNDSINNKFSNQPEARRKEWRKAVRASVSQQSGIITVMVYDTDQTRATVIARSIAKILTDESQEFHGKPNIVVKVVDDVYLKRFPVKPNLVGSTLAAIFFGALAGAALVVIIPTERKQSDKSKTGETSDEKAITAKPNHVLPHLAGRPDADGNVLQGNPPSDLPIDGEENDV